MESLRVVCVGGGLGAPTVRSRRSKLRTSSRSVPGASTRRSARALRGHYADRGLRYLEASPDEIATITGLGVRVVAAPVIDRWSGPRELWNKQDTLRHDSRRVAAAIVGLLSDRRPLLRAVE